jgi:hypothetical protein
MRKGGLFDKDAIFIEGKRIQKARRFPEAWRCGAEVHQHRFGRIEGMARRMDQCSMRDLQRRDSRMAAPNEAAPCARRVDDDSRTNGVPVAQPNQRLLGIMLELRRRTGNEVRSASSKCAQEHRLQSSGIELYVRTIQHSGAECGCDASARPMPLDQSGPGLRKLISP